MFAPSCPAGVGTYTYFGFYGFVALGDFRRFALRLSQKRSFLVLPAPRRKTATLRLAICSKTHTEIKVSILGNVNEF